MKERTTRVDPESLCCVRCCTYIYQPSRWSINVSVDLARGNTNIRRRRALRCLISTASFLRFCPAERPTLERRRHHHHHALAVSCIQTFPVQQQQKRERKNPSSLLFPPRYTYMHTTYIQDGRKKKKIWKRRLHKHKKRINKYMNQTGWWWRCVPTSEKQSVSFWCNFDDGLSLCTSLAFFNFYYIFQLMNYIHSSVLDATTWQPFYLEGCCCCNSKGVF